MLAEARVGDRQHVRLGRPARSGVVHDRDVRDQPGVQHSVQGLPLGDRLLGQPPHVRPGVEPSGADSVIADSVIDVLMSLPRRNGRLWG